MTTSVLRDQGLWVAGTRFRPVASALALSYEAELKDDTTLGDTTRSNLPGLRVITASHEGLYDADPYDSDMDALIGAAAFPASFGADGVTEGGVAYFFRAAQSSLERSAEIGELFGYSVALAGAKGGPLVRGTLMHDAAKTVTGTGTARNLGALSSNQKAYAALHVVAASGTTPTLDVTIESDDASGFASPLTRLTFAQVSATGHDWQELASPVTDTWWRVKWTIGGTSPSFDFAVVLGLQ